MRVLGVNATSSKLWLACADADGLSDIGEDYQLQALSSFAGQFGQHFDRIEQVTIFGNVKRSIPLHREPARDGLRWKGRSVVDFYHAEFAIEYDMRSDR